MSGLLTQLVASRRSETGATAVEYGVMVALIAVMIMVAVTAIGTNMSGMYNYIAGLV